MSNDRLLKETGLRYVTCMVRERQLRLLGHVGRFAESDPAHKALFEADAGGNRRAGIPRTSWLVQADRHLGELGLGWPDGSWDEAAEALGVSSQSG